MLLINCKVELTLKWTMHCVLDSSGVDNTNVNSNNVIFVIKDTKLYVPVVTFSVKDNQKLRKLLSEGFEKNKFLEMNIKQKQIIKIKLCRC